MGSAARHFFGLEVQRAGGRGKALPDDLGGLLEWTAQGSREAFAAVHERTYGASFGLLMVMLRDRDEASDVLQEAYIRIWTKAHLYRRTGAAPMSWIKMIVRNAAIDRLRARRRHESETVFEDVYPDEAGLGHEERITLGACMGELDEDKRALVHQVYLEGRTYEDMAARTGAPLNTVKSWLRRSLLQLQSCMGRGGPGA
ncbi:sigma-70 family RNA polymerase sigma factor [Roseovarius aquimarinus]|uniref:Sigma-70 family RNA polymerase sigma factor n=1 Tax=Roseovarius aquimarinus TaxID=1229156 RepID=A0ABW7I6L1_9RHOB